MNNHFLSTLAVPPLPSCYRWPRKDSQISEQQGPQTSSDPEKSISSSPILEDGQDIYGRFSKGKKHAIVAIVTFAALLAPFSFSSFLPSIPEISRDLHVSQATINDTVSVYMVVIGVAPLAWSPYSTFFGRQRIYLLSLPLFVAGSVGVAESYSLWVLVLTRTIQGIGASSVLAVGAGSIGDIYHPTERGRAMGLFYGGAVLGPAISPVLAGIMTEYVHGSRGSWRAFQYLLAALGVTCWLLMFFVLPETIHTRGVDIVRQKKAQYSKSQNRWTSVWLNPLKPLQLLRYRNVLVINLTSSFVLVATYSFLVPLTVTLGSRFGISNEAILGTLFFAPGLGNLVGSRLSGVVSDSTIARWIVRRDGVFIPEDRLRAALISSGLILPLSFLGAGFTMQFWTTSGGLALSLVFLFINGVGSLSVLAICDTYLVDTMQSRSAEVIATNNCLRYLAAAGASAAALPLIQTIGIAATNAIATVFAVVVFMLICITIKYGRGWREADALHEHQ